MIIKEPNYAQLLKYTRNGLAEQVHYGVILHINKKEIINKVGEDNNYKYYHRSCMKPLQISPLIDLGLDKKYNLTEEEIAVCSASHTGEVTHQQLVKSVLNKFDCKEEDLLCPPHEPISIEERKRILLKNIPFSKIHNNCSGKHALMLGICKEMGFPTKDYKSLDNPLSDYIINKVCELCETNINDVIISKDGCGLPVIATSLFALGIGFLNLFTNKKYEKIKNAFINNPYIIGGKGRLDSEIINASNNLITKVGACGLCVIVNIEKEEAIIVKIADSNMEARTFAVINALTQLKWLEMNTILSSQLNNIYIRDIITQDKEKIGTISPCFNLD